MTPRQRLRTAAVLCTGAVAAVTAVAGFALPASAATAGLRGVGSGRCLTVPNGSSGNGTQVQLADCTGGAGQQWTYTAGRQLQVYGSKCLDVSGHGTAAGTAAIIWDCTGGTNQQWNLQLDGTAIGVESGLCLDAVDQGTTNGTNVDVWTCNRGTNQQWTTLALTPASSSCPGSGHVSYTLDRAGSPTSDQTEAYNRITAAMDQAVAVYNCYTSITKALSVSYVPGVPTADGNYNGSIRFGATADMQQVTAMHEIGHTVGVGTYSSWSSFVSGGNWTGANAVGELRTLTGDSTAVLHADTQHFWPYGLNYTSEVTGPQDLVRHCLMVVALRRDMGL